MGLMVRCDNCSRFDIENDRGGYTVCPTCGTLCWPCYHLVDAPPPSLGGDPKHYHWNHTPAGEEDE